MRFCQIDRIQSLEVGKSITAVKCLALSEEYLQDHFPRFPVMPGVIMVESLFQASMWLVRATDEFRNSHVALRESKSIKFQGFMQPGDQLLVTATLKSHEAGRSTLRVGGEINGITSVSGRLVVESYNLADRGGDIATDDYMRMRFQSKFRRLCDQLSDKKQADENVNQ